MDEAFWRGVSEFNLGEFYACHDTLEALWMESSEPTKSFYQGILQIAVAVYHLENCNWQGAVTLLGEGIRRLYSYQPDYGEINVTHLVEQSSELLQFLQPIPPEKFPAIVKGLSANSFPKILKIDA